MQPIEAGIGVEVLDAGNVLIHGLLEQANRDLRFAQRNQDGRQRERLEANPSVEIEVNGALEGPFTYTAVMVPDVW